MMKFAGYQITDVICTSENAVVARATTESGGKVLLKYQNTQYPSMELNALWQQEFRVLKAIQSPWVVRAQAIRQAENCMILILEDQGQITLEQVIEKHQLSFSERLEIAVQLCSAVNDIHKHQLLHCDLSPRNVLITTAPVTLKLFNFGCAVWQNRQLAGIRSDGVPDSFEYMSPERTGRTNLAVDYRSDFYSLGVTLYQLFSGRKPFEQDDPTALIHAHLTRIPQALSELRADIPEALSGIVSRLLAKSPDDRYQSSYGLLADLCRCREEWQTHQRISPFIPGEKDVPERFSVANKLYGRESEKEDIMSAFERASAGRAEILLVSGYAGIGKTALVNELHKPVIARQGLFVRGKCDQFSRNQPYAALIQAFQPLMRQLLNEGEQQLSHWTGRLRRALGDNAGVIADIIPELISVVGPCPSPEPLPAVEAETRFQMAFMQFIEALSSSGRPLVLFLDDLQWADIPTLKLMAQQVLNGDQRALLIIATFRDNEVDPAHPLSNILKDLEQAEQRVRHLKLCNLNITQVTRMLSDTFYCEQEQVSSLANLCLEKTHGNPFFLNQFLMALYEDGELIYNREKGVWQWDIDHIRQRGITDNVIDFMLARLRRLDPDTQRLLALAAHLGNRFSIKMLALVSQTDRHGEFEGIPEETVNKLRPALQSGLVIPCGEAHGFRDSAGLPDSAEYRFLHDRVQHAAYSLTEEEERPQLQLVAGRLLLANTDPRDLEERLFTLLGLFNSAIHLITDPAEKKQVMDLNIRGGIKAKSASAYQNAVSLLSRAYSLLPEDPWNECPSDMLTICKELSEAEYLTGNFDRAEALYKTAIPQAPDAVAKVTLLLVQVDQYHIQGRFAESTPVLLLALSLLDEVFTKPDEISDQELLEEYGSTRDLLALETREQLLQMDEMTGQEDLLRMRVYNALSFATYQTGALKAFLVTACRMVRCTLNNGQCDLSSVGYVAYVTVMSAMGQTYPECYRMGKLAMDLAESRPNKYFRLTIYQYFCAFYQHWCEPLENSFGYLDKGVEWGYEGINLLSAGYCALLGSVNRFAKGLPLTELETQVEDGIRFLKKSQQPNTENYLRYGVMQPLLALQGKTLSPLGFDTASCNTTEFFAEDYDTPSIHLALHVWSRLRHAFLMDDISGQETFADKLPVVGMCLPDSPAMAEANFYVALIRAEQLSRDSDAKLMIDDERFREAQEIADRLKTWSAGCGENFLHKYLIVAARIAWLTGDDKMAMSSFSRAIEEAQVAGYPVYEALAHELYARYWRAGNQPQLATALIQEAYYHYQNWGAEAKCRLLESQWPSVPFNLGDRHTGRRQQSGHRKKPPQQTELLDLHSLLKANQLLSEDLRLESLLQKMMEVLLENAGAEKGAILLLDESKIMVEVTGRSTRGIQPANCTRVSMPLEVVCDNDRPQLPDSIIRHVLQTRETIIINRPSRDVRFGYDHYLQQQDPRSVLCLPILSQGKLIAVVYLENNLLENAFTRQHKKTLELLSSQAAISLINARLYDQMEEKVMKRTEQLRQITMKDGLTNIANRRSFDERLDSEWRRSLRNGSKMSLLMIDIDHFKEFNDFYGHPAGDACIKAVARALEQSAPRVTDFVARYGGEEFAVLMAESGEESALTIANACRETVAALAWPHSKSRTADHVTISLGVATMVASPGNNYSELITRADQALYRAKLQGRNQVCVYQENQPAQG